MSMHSIVRALIWFRCLAFRGVHLPAAVNHVSMDLMRAILYSRRMPPKRAIA